jgi:hypothetical protein
MGECTGQMSGVSTALTARKMNWLTKTNSVSARNASRDHPDAVTTNPARLSEDPADTTGDDEHCSDARTEPPDMPEGRGRQSGKQEVKEVQSSPRTEPKDGENAPRKAQCETRNEQWYGSDIAGHVRAIAVDPIDLMVLRAQRGAAEVSNEERRSSRLD